MLVQELVLALIVGVTSAQASDPVDHDVVARIRTEGLQRSQLPDTLSYMTDVVGPRR